MVSVLFNSQVIKNDTITLVNAQYAKTTKNKANGRWYYEFTHVSGTNYHLVGFKLDSARFYVYPQGCTSCLKLAYWSTDVQEDIACYGDIGFTDVVVDHTIGLSFDTFSRIFTIYYESQIRRFTILTSEKDTRASPDFVEASGSDNFCDTISLNFGEKPFKYNIPFGFLPWNQKFHFPSCNYKRSIVLKMGLF